MPIINIIVIENSENYPCGFDPGRGAASAAPAFLGSGKCEQSYMWMDSIFITEPSKTHPING